MKSVKIEMFWPAIQEKTQFLCFTFIWILENQSTWSVTLTHDTWIDSFQSYFKFEKHFLSSGNNFNPKSSKKWPKNANFCKLKNEAGYLHVMCVYGVLGVILGILGPILLKSSQILLNNAEKIEYSCQKHITFGIFLILHILISLKRWIFLMQTLLAMLAYSYIQYKVRTK